ncbi:ribokinase [Roseitalea porphyridii]|uniref:Ribokinase n=1 Tax=Roseitalea porphyridii TaxID=1852022 RepID=A0A4P6V007_9HYPH|nr:ribokinase [Roseitalea porphyridii]QBK29620.1 ribokinase [Roseitalea porphyridii]
MITIAGSVNLDLVARVERLPGPGETVTGVAYAEAPGGKGANQALAARRAGHAVAMAGAVGDDANAIAALSLLQVAGVDLSGVERLAAVPTGVALILVDDRTGENQIAVVPGANGRAMENGAPEAPGAGAWLLQMEIPDQAIAAALDAAAAAGATRYLNIAPYRASAGELARKADVVIANETEFDALAASLGIEPGRVEDRMAGAANALGVVLVLTLGADGALAVTGEGMVRATAPAIEPVDTVGAGDTFCGYLAAARAEGMAWPDALDLACRAGALACLTQGAQPSIPERAAVDAFTG